MKKKPLMVHVRRDRQTAPTATGKQYPIWFGSGSTETLMYIALNPGCGGREVCEALEVGVRTVSSRLRRLRAKKLIVGNHRYRINPGLTHYVDFVAFLRASAKKHGMAQVLGGGRRTYQGKRRSTPLSTSMPETLFGNRNRTTILLFIAGIQEAYGYEIREVLRISHGSVLNVLDALQHEGMIRSRAFRSLRIYSLGSLLPATWRLRKLILKMARDRTDVVAAVNAALVRRETIKREGWKGAKGVFYDLERRAQGRWSASGVQRTVGRRTWRIAAGVSLSAPFKRKRPD